MIDRMTFIQLSRAFYADDISRKGLFDAIMITVEEGLHCYEFAVRWYGGKTPSPRLEIFDDAWCVFSEIPEFFKMLAKYDQSRENCPSLTPQKLCEELLGMGFEDCTIETAPE